MKKISLTILLILVMVLSTVTVVNAREGDKATFSLTTANTDIKVGDEITVNLVIDNITGFDGINTFTATKVFDSTIFKYLGTEGQNGWENKGDNTNIVLKSNNHSTSGIIAVMKFKALKPIDNATIQLTNLDTCGDVGDVYFEDGNVNSPSVGFKITEKVIVNPNPDDGTDSNPDSGEGTNPGTNPGANSGTNNNKPGSTTSGNKTNNDKTTATGSKIPQTGDSYFVTTLVIVGIALAVILFAKYKLLERKTR